MEFWLPILISLFGVFASALGAFWGVRVSVARIEEQLRFHDHRLARLEEIEDRRREK
ncbi:MAG: hypothetical protein ACRDGM_04300 [bacterium]